MPDPASQDPFSITWPAAGADVVTPSDSTNLPNYSRAIHIGTAGNISVVFAGQPDNATPIVLAVAAASVYPYRLKRIYSTGTTAGGLVVVY